MEEVVENAVNRVIQSMRTNIAESITVDDMARTAMFSKFHFSRVFQKATGISPGRFLSAIRLQEAKHLLITTSLSVTDISHRVGYASVGTFSSRFRDSIGVSPTIYRRLGGFTSRICADDRLRTRPRRPATIRGCIRPPASGHLGMIFVGLFPDRLPQGRPIRCAVLDRPGTYSLEDVPQGTWHLLVYSAADNDVPGPDNLIPAQRSGEGTDAFVGSYGPITIRPDTGLRPADVPLRPMTSFDPPVLLALLRSQAVG
jgi:AraC family transcriptional regulator